MGCAARFGVILSLVLKKEKAQVTFSSGQSEFAKTKKWHAPRASAPTSSMWLLLVCFCAWAQLLFFVSGFFLKLGCTAHFARGAAHFLVCFAKVD